MHPLQTHITTAGRQNGDMLTNMNNQFQHILLQFSQERACSGLVMHVHLTCMTSIMSHNLHQQQVASTM
jgi:hypothetical protein